MRQIAGLKKINKRRTEELREEICVKEFKEEAGEELVKVDCTCRVTKWKGNG